MTISSRSLLGADGAAFLAGGLRARSRGLKIRVTDWNLRLTGKVDCYSEKDSLERPPVEHAQLRPEIYAATPQRSNAYHALAAQRVELDGNLPNQEVAKRIYNRSLCGSP